MVRMSETVNINCLCKQLTSTVVRLYVPWQIYLRAVYFLSLCISVCAQCITDQMCYVSMMSFWIELGNMMIWYWYWTAWYTFMSIAFIVRYLKKKKNYQLMFPSFSSLNTLIFIISGQKTNPWNFTGPLLALCWPNLTKLYLHILAAMLSCLLSNGCRLCTMDVSTFLFYLQLCDEWCIFFPENSELYSQCYRFNKQMCLYVDWSKANTSEYSGTHLKVKKCFCVYYWYCVFNVRVSAAFLTFLGIPSWGAFSVGFFLIGGQNFRFTSFSWPRRKIRNAAKA